MVCRRNLLLHSRRTTRMIKAAGSSETSIQFYQTALRHIENAVVFIASARLTENLARRKLFLNLCVCVFVCVYVCMCVCVYVCTYVCMYVRMYIQMYVCTYVCMYVCMCVRMYVRTYVCIYV